MSRIKCTQKLWRRLGHSGRPPIQSLHRLIPGSALGSWAADVLKYYGRELVIGLNERTHLAVLFPLSPRGQFHSNFASALANLLSDLRLPDGVIQAECTALEFAQLSRLTGRKLAEAFNHIKFECGIELDTHDDLHVVQRNLSELPHTDIELCIPAREVRQLFEVAYAPTVVGRIADA